MHKLTGQFLILFFIVFTACETEKNQTLAKTKAEKLFEEVPSSKSNITFRNDVTESLTFNFLNYPYIYIGGGVAVGDFNQDNLPDIYLAANQKENKLYLNNGDLSFTDITEASGTKDSEGWTTGLATVDINNDGWLDIYVCKSASVKNNELRENKLFINNQDGTFSESAEAFGLNDAGFSTQAYFLDFDNDGDLDMYLVNHRPDFNNNGTISSEIQRQRSPLTSDQLYRNNGNNTFTNISNAAGISNKAWGLSAAVGDYNNDGWQDVYVCNDYLEPDILYINNQDGTFSDQVLNRMNHISFNSMGSDLADINNDGFQDLIVLDMLAEDHERSKENMATMSTKNFWSMVNIGYHHQYMSNMLQVNDGNGFFSEVGQLSGINKTDWSWAPLIADFDNDGLKDIFVTNGIYKDLGNQDFRRNLKMKNNAGKSMTLNDVLTMAPSSKLSNKAFKNTNGISFKNVAKDWGLDTPTFSNGVAYGDFDNDGDLDLVINNFNSEALVYENKAHQNSVQLKLKGFPNNHLAIGTKVSLTANGQSQYQELFLSRGFESSVENIIAFGIGDATTIEGLQITWPNGTVTTLDSIAINQTVEIDYETAEKTSPISSENTSKTHFSKLEVQDLGIKFQHVENDFNDFAVQVLLPQKKSTLGGFVTVGDVNGDGKDDFFVGNATGKAAAMYLQQENGMFSELTKNTTLWEKEKGYEDLNALLFDSDSDGDLDLYVVSGGYEHNENAALLQDRLYLNDGTGAFKKTTALPEMRTSGKSIAASDFDNDGDLDLFVGGNLIPGKYPLSPTSYLLENEQGIFSDVTDKIAKEVKEYGIINTAKFLDIDGDQDEDLILAGEWIPVTVFKNEEGIFNKIENPDIDAKTGWWNSLAAHDFDNDGDLDLIAGNFGNNNKFHPSEKKPLHVYGNDFDENGSFDMVLSKLYKGRMVPLRGKECSTEQNPFVSEKIQSYQEFAKSELSDIYGKEELENAFHLQATEFKTSYLENDGTGKFSIRDLNIEAQFGPTFAMVLADVNRDGHMDVIGTGSEFNAEVETIRYDAAKGFVLLGDSNGNFNALRDTSFYTNLNSKDIKRIKINDKLMLLVANNNGPLELFKIN